MTFDFDEIAQRLPHDNWVHLTVAERDELVRLANAPDLWAEMERDRALERVAELEASMAEPREE